MLERVLDIRFTRYGTVLEGLELVCCMTGFRLHQRALGRIEFREHS